MLPPRRKSRQVRIGDVLIGGNAPVSVQSMTTTDTADVKATLAQIARLVDAGVDIVRVAVPDKQAAAALPELIAQTPAPLVADIHFDYRLALAALDAGIHALRLNPGNIEKEDYVRQVVTKAKERDVPIRIGVNFGSIPKITKEESDEITRTVSNTTELIAEQMVRRRLEACPHSGGHGLHQHQDLAKGVRCADDDRSLHADRRPGGLPAAPGRDRGWYAESRLGPLGGGHRLSAGARHRRHDPRLARAATP